MGGQAEISHWPLPKREAWGGEGPTRGWGVKDPLNRQGKSLTKEFTSMAGDISNKLQIFRR